LSAVVPLRCRDDRKGVTGLTFARPVSRLAAVDVPPIRPLLFALSL
jgi:hypothetical protein